MKKSFVIITAALISFYAGQSFACCPPGDNSPRCNLNFSGTVPKKTGASTQFNKGASTKTSTQTK